MKTLVALMLISPLRWATGVHDLMIDLAFPNEDIVCRAQMKQGSRDVDKMQGPVEAYMHAMRSTDESVETAIGKTWKFIDRKYADARQDLTYLDDHPELLRDTIEIMKVVDQMGLEFTPR